MASKCSAADNFIDTGCLDPSGSSENLSLGLYTLSYFFFLEASSRLIPSGTAMEGILEVFPYLVFYRIFILFYFSYELREVLPLFEATPPIALQPS